MTRRLWLHIGSHKTGSTSLQTALRQGQSDKTLGRWSYLHARPRVDFNPLVRCHGMGAGMHTELRWPFLERRMADADHRGHGDCILSSEMLFWLMDVADLEALRQQLLTHFDEISVVAYLRRQDALALSHRKQVVMGRAAYQFYGAQIRGLPEFQPHMMRYFDYATKLARWEQVFGAENVTVRRFQRGDLVGGDTVLDFYHLVGLTPPPELPQENAAWSRSQLLAGLWLRQRGYPRQSFAEAVQELPDDGRLMPARDDAAAFLARFEAINRALAARYDPQGPEMFFDCDLSRYPEAGNGEGLEGDAVVTPEVLADLEARAQAERAARELPLDALNPDDRL
ncbi:hypothetical protein [Phaeobacter inhibens]|uniref:hypothetical protein n=1 Tax=Phaeobacter inhibens TaxID=221822 RepID=UPI000C9C2F69|nr:hypothetical protein [Phaeobacter inhibens]AUQ84656.1 glycosyl transferase domain-containing protein [Phaeobacter inhibens]